ncbi:hypothetical protein ACFY7F_24225 [Streptomyces griseofuscus]|uniref:hypothetical protein n=1 Tax=Streptomyces griseofuscus TaxID=146922 RepID=UPI00368B800B
MPPLPVGQLVGRRLPEAYTPRVLVDRRGYGDSPDTACSDVDVDAEGIVEVLGDEVSTAGVGGAHLVGHGNGAVAALTAAAHHPVVADLLDRVREGAPGIPDGVAP